MGASPGERPSWRLGTGGGYVCPEEFLAAWKSGTHDTGPRGLRSECGSKDQDEYLH